MTKVDIFSGFLGAGKTTLIKKLISEAYRGEKLVLIENEFGEIGVDGGFMQDAGIEVTEMNSGCICCSLVGDFAAALKKVLETYSPDRILIEPSGVGKLSEVIAAVRGVDSAELELNSFTTVIDAKRCKMHIKNFGEFFLDQIEHASCIVLSRTQDMSEDKLAAALALLREHNDEAPIITTPWDELSGGDILVSMERSNTLEAELERLMDEQKHEHHHHEHGEHCGCRDHDDDDEHECCGHHKHEHDGEHECCGRHKHEHDGEHECCGRHKHEHDGEHECCGRHKHEHDGEHECCGRHKHEHDGEHECCGRHKHEHHHEHGENCTCGCHDHDHEEHEHHHHHEHGENCTCGCHDHDHDADEVFTSWGVETAKRFSEQDIAAALAALEDEERFGLVLRAKGIVDAGDGWIHFDYVPGEPEVRRGAASTTGRLCVIGSGLDNAALAALFGV